MSIGQAGQDVLDVPDPGLLTAGRNRNARFGELGGRRACLRPIGLCDEDILHVAELLFVSTV